MPATVHQHRAGRRPKPVFERVDAFDEDEAYTGTYLAAQIAVAVAEEQQTDSLRIGALNRAIIGQAQGILMERYKIDADQAFNVMRRVSQDNNIKLIRVADELVRTRRTPGVAAPLTRCGTGNVNGLNNHQCGLMGTQ